MRDNFIKRLKDKEDFSVIVDEKLSREIQTIAFSENVFWSLGQKFVCFTEFTLLIFHNVRGKMVIKCSSKEMLEVTAVILNVPHVIYDAETDTFK